VTAAHRGMDDRGANRRHRRSFENNRHIVADSLSPALEPADQCNHCPPTVPPPTVRAGPDHVHAVDDPAHQPTRVSIGWKRSAAEWRTGPDAVLPNRHRLPVHTAGDLGEDLALGRDLLLAGGFLAFGGSRVVEQVEPAASYAIHDLWGDRIGERRNLANR